MGMMIGNVEERNGLYYLIASPLRPGAFKKFSLSSVSDSSVFLWHNRFGHLNFTYLKYLYPDLFLNKDVSSFNCEHCIFAKQSCKPHPTHCYHASKPFHLIHSDIWGQLVCPTLLELNGSLLS